MTEIPTAECPECGELVEAEMFDGTPILINGLLTHYQDKHIRQTGNSGVSDQ